MSREAVEQWQGERLREVVGWVRGHSPFYREFYQDIPAAGPAGLGDLESLPLLESAVLREHGQELICVSLGDIARVTTLPTSGSTGVPKRLWFTEEDLELTADHFRHGMRPVVGPGERLLVLMPGKTPGSVGALLAEGLGRDGIEVSSYGFVDDCAAVAACIDDFGADALVGVPGQVVRLARSEPGRRIGWDRVKNVLLSGDHVTPAMRAAIEEAWGCGVFEHYGSTEIGLGGAVQCRAHAGLHVREADLLFEVIDPETGRSLPDGSAGELVVTTLTRRGMPLIRLRTGDLVRMSDRPCRCGSVLRSIDTVVGRMAERIRLEGGGTLTVSDLDEAVYAADAVMGFEAVLERGDAGDRLVVAVEVSGQAPDTLAQVEDRIRALPHVQAAGLEIRLEAADGAPEGPLSAKQRIVDAREGAPR